MNRFPRTTVAALITLALAGCGTNTQTTGTQPAVRLPTTTPVPTDVALQNVTTPVAFGQFTPVAASSLPPYKPVIDPAAFVTTITNPLFPLTPGMTFIYEGTRDGVPRRAEVTVSRETKTILGVACIVVRDVVTSNNALVEKTTDWYAQDQAGNVWYFGEDTAEYENGKVTSTAGTWLAGVDGAMPGIVMKAAPQVGDAYRQEYRPGEAEDFAKVLQLDASTGSYTKVLVTQDTDLLDANKLEHKFYAPGVGYLGSTGVVNGHQEDVRLTSVLKGN